MLLLSFLSSLEPFFGIATIFLPENTWGISSANLRQTGGLDRVNSLNWIKKNEWAQKTGTLQNNQTLKDDICHPRQFW